jgi:hypothetical protein
LGEARHQQEGERVAKNEEIEALKEKVLETEKEGREKQRQLEQAKAEVVQMESDWGEKQDEHQKEVEALKAQVSNFQRLSEDLREASTGASSRRDSPEKQLKDSATEIFHLQATFAGRHDNDKARNRRHESESERLSRNIELLNHEISSLLSERADLRKELVRVRGQFRQALAAKAKVESDLERDRLNSQLIKKALKDILQGTNDAKIVTSDDSIDLVQELKSLVEYTQKARDEAVRAGLQLENALEESNECCAGLRKSIEEKNDSLIDLRRTFMEEKKQMMGELLELDGVVGQVASENIATKRQLQAELSTMMQENEKLQSKLSAAQSEIEKLVEELQHSEIAQDSLRGAKKRLEQSLDENAQNMKEMACQQAKSEKDRSALEASLKESLLTAEKLRQKQAEMAYQQAQSEKDRSALEGSLKESLFTAEKLREKQAASEQEYETLRESNKSIQESLKQAVGQLQRLGAEKQALRNFVDNIVRERDDALKLKTLLEQSLNEARESVGNLKSSVAMLGLESEHLRSVLNQNGASKQKPRDANKKNSLNGPSENANDIPLNRFTTQLTGIEDEQTDNAEDTEVQHDSRKVENKAVSTGRADRIDNVKDAEGSDARPSSGPRKVVPVPLVAEKPYVKGVAGEVGPTRIGVLDDSKSLVREAHLAISRPATSPSKEEQSADIVPSESAASLRAGKRQKISANVSFKVPLTDRNKDRDFHNGELLPSRSHSLDGKLHPLLQMQDQQEQSDDQKYSSELLQVARQARHLEKLESRRQDSISPVMRDEDGPREAMAKGHTQEGRPSSPSVPEQSALRPIRRSSVQRVLDSSSRPSHQLLPRDLSPSNSRRAGSTTDKATYVQQRLAKSTAKAATKTTRRSRPTASLADPSSPRISAHRQSARPKEGSARPRYASSVDDQRRRFDPEVFDPPLTNPTGRRSHSSASPTRAATLSDELTQPSASASTPPPPPPRRPSRWSDRQMTLPTLSSPPRTRETRMLREMPQPLPSRPRRVGPNPVTVALESICDPPDREMRDVSGEYQDVWESPRTRLNRVRVKAR